VEPPLSLSAEQLLDTLRRECRAESGVWDWFDTLLRLEPDLVVEAAGAADLEDLSNAARAAVDRGSRLAIDEVTSRARGIAGEAGRPIASKIDVAAAVVQAARSTKEAARRPLLAENSPPLPHEGASFDIETKELPTAGNTEDLRPLTMSAAGLVDSLMGGKSERGLCELLVALVQGHPDAVSAAGAGVDTTAVVAAARAHLDAGNVGAAWSRAVLAARAGSLALERGRPVARPAEVASALLEGGRELLTPPALVGPAATQPREPAELPAPLEPAATEPEPADVAPEVPARGGASPQAAAASPAKVRRGRAPIFRVFVSSTFDDMAAERDALARLAWPQLRAFCEREGARFQAIDLRWGVSEEAGLDQQTMRLCLDEVRRCHQVTPRPNFLLLVGNHYGWRPLPPAIPAGEFAAILEHVAGPEQAALQEWYLRDDNAAPEAEYYLKPRDPDGPFGTSEDESERKKRSKAWDDKSEALRRILLGALERLGWDDARRAKYLQSATEQEIRCGALGPEASAESAFWVRRDITGKPSDGASADEKAAFGGFVDEDQEPITELRAALHEHLGRPVMAYAEIWQPGGPSAERADEMAEKVREALQAAIEKELADPSEPAAGRLDRPVPPDDLLDEEGREHRRFAEGRVQVFVGREEQLAAVDRYLRGDSARPLVVGSGGGTGKSAFLSEAVRRALTGGPEALFVYRFVGATPGSSDGRTLLDGVCRELARRSGADETAVPSHYQELVKDFAERLGAGSPKRPVVVVLDSLDQLSAADGARHLSWIPSPLPAHARLVVSTRDADAGGRPLETFQAIRGRGEWLPLPPLSVTDGKTLLAEWLRRAGRTLQVAQEQAVLDAFTRSLEQPADDRPAPRQEAGGTPLYLLLAFEEARRWRSGDGQPPEVLAHGIKPLISENLFSRLASEDGHGPTLVARALGYLGAARYGLAEDELLDVLARDHDLYAWFMQASFHLPPDLIPLAVEYLEESRGKKVMPSEAVAWLREVRSGGGKEIGPELAEFLTAVLPRSDGPRLPVVLWSRLGFDLRPYLTERLSESGPLLGFYHRELEEAVAETYLAGEQAALLHSRLADYFHQKADAAGDRRWVGSTGEAHLRGLGELPFHLTKAGRGDDLVTVLTDFVFLEQKAAHVGQVARGTGEKEETIYTGVFQLQEDFALAAPGPAAGAAGAGSSSPRWTSARAWCCTAPTATPSTPSRPSGRATRSTAPTRTAGDR
jgi:hypothetical protein